MNRLNFVRVLLVVLLIIPAPSLAQTSKPVITGPVRNGASMLGFPTERNRPGGFGLAPGSIFTIFGSAIGPSELTHGAVPYPVRLPAGPGGTEVSFRSIESGQVFQAYLIYASAGQVAGIIPSDVPLGHTELRVTYDGAVSEPTVVWIAEAAPGLFTVSQNGRGPGVIQNYESRGSQPSNSLSRPAELGQYLILWGTGLGAIAGPDNVPPLIGNVRNDVVVRFRSNEGFVEAPAEYAGRAPGFPGVDQINVRIPDDGSVELGCYTDLEVQAGNVSSPGVTFALSDTPGQCEHPWGLSAEQEAALDRGETKTFLHLQLTGPDLEARIANADATGVALNLGASALGDCSWGDASCNPVLFLGARVPSPNSPAFVPLPPGLSRADPGQLRLVGPDLRAIQLERSVYDAVSFKPRADLADGFFIGGEWMLRVSGGRDMASFEQSFRIPPMPPIQFPAVVGMSDDIEFSWDPQPYEGHVLVHVFLREANPGQTSGRGVGCNFLAAAGSLKISAEDLATLEAEAGSKLRWEMNVYDEPLTFTAPGLEHGQIATTLRVTQEATVVE